MPKNNESLNKELYSLLKTRGFDPIPKDATGETSPVPDDADVFKFTFKHDNQVKGTAYATIDGNNTLTVYYDDEVVSEEVGGVDDVNMSWTNFLKYLKMWAQRRQMGFDLENKDHLHSDMAQRDYVKKQEVAESKKKLMNKGTTMPNISEGYYAMGKNSSYNDNIPTVKIILQHSRQIQEGEQRYRNVARIYLENTQGERFLAPTVKPGIAQVYARHLAEGGSVNDERWNHIKSLCEEYSKMAGFVRAVRGNQFNESAQKLVEAGLNHYVSLRETLGKMRGNRGYNSYFESWTPTLMETDGDETSINELFVQETLDPRIESVMPILSKLSKNLSEVKEVKELEEWANGLLEAPGAETLAHNQSTAKSNLKSFDLEEDSVNEGWFADTLKSVGKAVLDKLAPNDKQLLLKLQRDMGVPTTAQHGKPSMARMMSDEEVQKLIAAARKVNAGRNSSLSEEEVEESGLQAYLGNKKYGKDGMDSLRKAGREGASKEKMAKIRAKYDKLDEEGLGPEQKRVGQLGPTEKVKKNSGARGKLVGANESVEQGVAEGSTNKTLFVIYYKTGKGFDAGTGDVGILASNEQKAKEKFAKKYPHFIVTKIVEGMKYVLVDYRGNYYKGMDKFGRNLSTRNPEEAEIFNLERDAKDIALWTRNRFKAIPWSGQRGVAEGLPGSLSASDYMPGATLPHTNWNCIKCSGHKFMYSLDGKLTKDNKKGAIRVKCPDCGGSGLKKPDPGHDYFGRKKEEGVAEGSEQDLVYISKDRAEAFEEWMNSEGLETNVPKNDYGTYIVYNYSNEDPTSKLYASEWNERREGVAEGTDDPNPSAGPGSISHSTPVRRNGKDVGELFQTKSGSWGFFINTSAKTKEGFESKEKALEAMKQHLGQGMAEGMEQEWEVSFEHGPHQSDSVKVKASSKEEAISKAKEQAKKTFRTQSLSLNWARPVKKGVAEGQEDLDALKKLMGK